MYEKEEDLSFMMLKILNSSDLTLGEIFNSLNDILDSNPKVLPGYLQSTLFSGLYHPNLKTVLIGFLTNILNEKLLEYSEMLMFLFRESRPHEIFLIFEILVNKNISRVG